jgi:hypothetical protein
MNSQFLKLNANDLFKGVLVIVGTAILTAILPMLQSGKIPTLEELKVVVLASVSAGITYFLKNLLTNSDGNIKTEVK